jgi:hypothetical protein
MAVGTVAVAAERQFAELAVAGIVELDSPAGLVMMTGSHCLQIELAAVLALVEH